MSRSTVRLLARQALGLGLENETNAEVVINVNVAPEEPPVEEDEIEIEEVASEVEADTDTIEELEEAEVALEAIAASLEAHIQDGGLDTQSVVYLNHAVNGVVGRFGLTSQKVSVESFAGTYSDRLSASTEALGDIKEKAAKVGEAVINGIKKLIQTLRDLFAKIFVSFDRLSKRAGALREVAKKANFSGTPSTVDLNPVVAERLTVKGEFDGVKAIQNLKDQSATFIGGLKNDATNALRATAPEVAIRALGEKLAKVGEIGGGFGVKTPEEGFPYFGKVVEEVDVKGPFAAPSVAELEQILKNIQEVATDIAGFKADTDKIFKTIEGDLAKAKRDAGGKAKTDVAKAVLNLEGSYVKFAFRTARAGLTYAERSIAAYNGKKPEEKADK